MKKRTKRLKLLKGEKFMYFLLLALFVAIPVVNVFSKSLVSKTNIEVEKLQNKIDKQKNNNEALSMQINELASLENIENIANQYGLSYNNSNILTVKGEEGK
jgi:cell division protein FtsL